MPSDNHKRKRLVASCMPCYSKKQKCDRHYPCNNCTRRRRPELCSYEADSQEKTAVTTSPGASGGSRSPTSTPLGQSQDTFISDLPTLTRNQGDLPLANNTLSKCLGYFEGSSSNLLGLMDKFGMLSRGDIKLEDETFSAQDSVEVTACLQSLPKRQILDRLIQVFLKDVNWMHEMIHPATFLECYENWFKASSVTKVGDLEFGVLILRICAYSAQFLPSREYTASTIAGVTLETIREDCHTLASRIVRLCETVVDTGSLTRVQHQFYTACYLENEGQIKQAWYETGKAIRLAQDLGMHLEATPTNHPKLNVLEREMRRRAFWNLYIWDRFLSFVLDRLPCIPDEYCSVSIPKMRLSRERDHPEAPDLFQERMLQIRLMKLWYAMCPVKNGRPQVYEPNLVEEQSERLHREFIYVLPPVFSFANPDTQWDEQIPTLKRQRQMLRITVLALSLSFFRPLLHLQPVELESLPAYKVDLVLAHREHLVDGAVSLLESVACLHDLMGGNQTKFFLLSFYTFEPAVLLGMHLISLDSFYQMLDQARSTQQGSNSWKPERSTEPVRTTRIDPAQVTRCRLHINKALERLNILREVSMIAELGARKLGQLVTRLDTLFQSSSSSADAVNSYCFSDSNSTMSSTRRNMPDSREGNSKDIFDIDFTRYPWPDSPHQSSTSAILDSFIAQPIGTRTGNPSGKAPPFDTWSTYQSYDGTLGRIHPDAALLGQNSYWNNSMTFPRTNTGTRNEEDWSYPAQNSSSPPLSPLSTLDQRSAREPFSQSTSSSEERTPFTCTPMTNSRNMSYNEHQEWPTRLDR